MKTMKTGGIITVTVGAIMIFFPHLVGSFIFAAIAFVIAIFSLITAIREYQAKRFWALPLSLLLFILAVLIMKKPSLSLKYLGYAIILHSAHGLFIIKQKSYTFSYITLVITGFFLILNHAVAMNTIIFLLGVVVILIGALLFLSSSAFVQTGLYSRGGYKRKPKKIIIEDDNVQEVDYKDIEE